jgi:hypothetical protein
VLDLWWAYYQCEPFGSHWEQTANVTAMIHGMTSMLAATHGTKLEPLSVVDLLPGDSMPWRKRTKLRRNGIKHPKIQSQMIKHAFGFT